MHAAQASTRHTDPYRAGWALGTALKAQHPRLVLCFASSHLADFDEFLEALHDALGDPQVCIVGNIAQSVFCGRETIERGACALGLGGSGWDFACAHAEAIGSDTEAAVTQCWQRVAHALQGRSAELLLLGADCRVDSARLEAALRRTLPRAAVGGLASYDMKQVLRSGIFAGRRCIEHGFFLLALTQSAAAQVLVGDGLLTLSRRARIEHSEGAHIARIDGSSAAAFIERETGKPLLDSDRGMLALRVYEQTGKASRLRSIAATGSDGGIKIFGLAPEGDELELCSADPASITTGLYRAIRQARRRRHHPLAALVFSCAGRAWALGDQLGLEARAVSALSRQPLPLVGYPSFGEFGPAANTSAEDSETYFHSMTCMVLALESTAQ